MPIKVTGVEQIEARLKRLIVSKMVKEALINTVTAGAEILRDDAASRVKNPSDIGMQVTKKRARKAEAQVGPTRDKWFLRFTETGATKHEIKGKSEQLVFLDDVFFKGWHVDHPGMAAHPFLRPAMNAKGQAAMEAAGEAFWNTLFKGKGE